MPQMAPMSWTMLFMMFIINMMIMVMMNYYLYTPTPKKINKNCGDLSIMNWKW
uniref:ATP synthase F0 subunit 8 n=1 Tax=Neurobasis chinensis TaxID=62024 RepID=UPI00211416B9|nr:ATP synthase F0 subunit 8 [Neurobasis chinensis]UTB53944.1 ATP synthase F0 subunit 8 [Neurobasis chinensis]